MSPEDHAFIARRRRQIRYWPGMAAVLLLLLAGAFGWLWQHAPVYVRPHLVIELFQARQLPEPALVLLAARGSLAVIGCGLFVLLLLLLISLSLWNERRLIRLLDEALAAQQPASGPAAAPPAAASAPADHD